MCKGWRFPCLSHRVKCRSGNRLLNTEIANHCILLQRQGPNWSEWREKQLSMRELYCFSRCEQPVVDMLLTCTQEWFHCHEATATGGGNSHVNPSFHPTVVEWNLGLPQKVPNCLIWQQRWNSQHVQHSHPLQIFNSIFFINDNLW